MLQPAHNTISEMMENYADEAVRRSGEFDAALDFSETSLRALDAILGRIADKLSKLDNRKDVKESTQERIEAASRIWGGYFGETIRRLWGGDWGVETYPGTLAPVVSIDIGGAKLFPVMKVYRRLTQGEDENLWKFYQMLREKVALGGTRRPAN